MQAWTVPRLWEGKTVAVLASGPSMSRAVADDVFAARIPAIVVNDTYLLAPWADMLYAADAAWWAAHSGAADFQGLRVTVQDVGCALKLRCSGPAGFDPHPGAVRSGGHSGHQAVHIAMHAGAQRILLCGFDMRGTHWHGEHPEPLRNTAQGTYGRWCEQFAELGNSAISLRIEIINCTSGSALTCFPAMSLSEALRLAREDRDAQAGTVAAP
jgi:hypothetical protein